MKYEVCFAMCHYEYTNVKLNEKDVKNKTEDEIKALVRKKAWHQIKQECAEYDAEEIIEIKKLEDWE